MIEINIELTMDDSGNILIKRGEENQYSIKFESKIINAQKVYDLLDYKQEYAYKISSNIESINDTRMKEYFEDIVDLFEKIIQDVNKLNEECNEIEGIDEDAETEDLPF